MKQTKQAITDFVAQYQASNGKAPTLQEIADGVGLKSKQLAAYHVNKLVDAGVITRDAGWRGTKVTAVAQ